MPIFCVISVKLYTGQKHLHGYIRGILDKYEVCKQMYLTRMGKLSMIASLPWPLLCLQLLLTWFGIGSDSLSLSHLIWIGLSTKYHQITLTLIIKSPSSLNLALSLLSRSSNLWLFTSSLLIYQVHPPESFPILLTD